MASSPTPRPPLARSSTSDTTVFPPRPQDAGTSSWTKALDLYLASYDSTGNADFSGAGISGGGVLSSVTPAPQYDPPPIRAPLSIVNSNKRDDEDMRRRLNQRLTQGLSLSSSERTYQNRAHLLGWSERPGLGRFASDQNTHAIPDRVPSMYRQSFDRDRKEGDLGELHTLQRLKLDAPTRSSRQRPKPRPLRAALSDGSESSSSGVSGASTSSTSSDDSAPSSSVSGQSQNVSMGRTGKEKRRDARFSQKLKIPETEAFPESPDATAARRVDALLHGLGVVVPGADLNVSNIQSAMIRYKKIAPAPTPAPESSSSRRGRHVQSVSKRTNSSAEGSGSQSGSGSESCQSASSAQSSGSLSDYESSGESMQLSQSTAKSGSRSGSQSGSDAELVPLPSRAVNKTPEDIDNTRISRIAKSSRLSHSLSLSASSLAVTTRAAQTLAEDMSSVSSVSSDSEASGSDEAFSDGESQSTQLTVIAPRSQRHDALAEEVRLSLLTLDSIRDTHSLPASPPDSPERRVRRERREARRAERADADAFSETDSGESDEVTKIVSALAAAPASPSGLTGAARVRVMYPELFA